MNLLPTMTSRRTQRDRILRDAIVLPLVTLALVWVALWTTDYLFLHDPNTSNILRGAEELEGLSNHDRTLLDRLIDENQVTFDPTSGARMGEAIAHLKPSDATKVLLVGASMIAYPRLEDVGDTFFEKRVDSYLKQLGGDNIEVYNLSAAGLNLQETINVIEKAQQRLKFDHVIVALTMRLAYHNSPRESMVDMPDPLPAVNDHGAANVLLTVLTPERINANVNRWVTESVDGLLPGLKRRTAIQNWIESKFLDVTAPAPTPAEVPPGFEPTDVPIPELEDLTGFTEDFSEWTDSGPANWELRMGERPPGDTRSVTRSEAPDNAGNYTLIFNGGDSPYTGIAANRTLTFPESLAGQTVRFSVDVLSSDPLARDRIGFYIEGADGFFQEYHPGDGKWRRLEISFTFSYTAKNRSVTVNLTRQGGSKPATMFRAPVLDFTDAVPVQQFRFSPDMMQTIHKNTEALLDFLARAQEETGTPMSVLLTPMARVDGHAVYLPERYHQEYAERIRQRCAETGMRLLDARDLLPLDRFRTSPASPQLDPLHFTPAGHAELARYLADQLALL